VRKARQHHRHLVAVCLSNVGALTSHNPVSLHGLSGIALPYTIRRRVQSVSAYGLFSDTVSSSGCVQMLKLSLRLINHAPRHEDVWRSGRIASAFLISALDGGE
jgi:hypothetical protein